MRLTLMKKDYVRAHIVSNKVKRSTLEEEGMATLKVKFYTLLASYYKHDKNALELAKCYHAIYSTACVQAVEESEGENMGWKEALTNTIVFLCLSEYGNEVKDMMERVNVDIKLDKIVECNDTIKAFLKDEIIHYPLPHQTTLESIPSLSNTQDDSDLKSHWHTTFHTRIIQHNLRTTSIYYRQIHLSRLSQLLSLTPAETERHISQMVSFGSLYAKIDRPKDIVRFAKKRCEEEVLTDWAEDIKELLGLVEKTTYLIQKENMVQSH
jgi:26S proteasome regulatory subunit N5